MKVLTPQFVSLWKNRILNIHPSLLPIFPWLNTHTRVIKSGMKLHGSTVHLVYLENKEKKIYNIVGKDEADMTKNYIYFRSPIG